LLQLWTTKPELFKVVPDIGNIPGNGTVVVSITLKPLQVGIFGGVKGFTHGINNGFIMFSSSPQKPSPKPPSAKFMVMSATISPDVSLQSEPAKMEQFWSTLEDSIIKKVKVPCKFAGAAPDIAAAPNNPATSQHVQNPCEVAHQGSCLRSCSARFLFA
jgi:hypothetical protein